MNTVEQWVQAGYRVGRWVRRVTCRITGGGRVEAPVGGKLPEVLVRQLRCRRDLIVAAQRFSGRGVGLRALRDNFRYPIAVLVDRHLHIQVQAVGIRRLGDRIEHNLAEITELIGDKQPCQHQQREQCRSRQRRPDQ